MDFSVILLSYNTDFFSIKTTIDSILNQKNISFEIIFADDFSRECPYRKIENYLKKCEFKKYHFVSVNQNVGTVKNLLRALNYCHANYIKAIGAGDLLFDENTLRKVLNQFLEKGVDIIAGKMISFNWKDGKRNPVKFLYPRLPEIYIKGNKEEVKWNLIVYKDNISGATLFYKKEILLKYLQLIENRILLAEDLIQVMYILDNNRIEYLDYPVVYYEVGSGVSTGEISPLLKKDFKEFEILLKEMYPKNIYVNKRIEGEALRESQNVYKKVKFVLKNKPMLFFKKTLKKIIKKDK